jgi:hypothetical protein
MGVGGRMTGEKRNARNAEGRNRDIIRGTGILLESLRKRSKKV